MGDHSNRSMPCSDDAGNRWKAYGAYKDSGVEWLGQIPEHWQVKRLKYLASINDEALGEDTDPNLEISYVDIGNVDSVLGIVAKEDLVFENAPSRARRIVRHGDLVISTVRTYLRAIAPITDPEVNLIVSTGFAIVRPKDLETSFAAYACRAPYFVDRVVANSVGVSYPAINAGQIACFPITYPDAQEQRTIGAFLDRETAKIDALIAKKERLIELLQEKRTALITQAVTKGLPSTGSGQASPNVPMKDSGVEWLGEIPAHWELRRNKLLFVEVDDRSEFGDEELLTVSHITGVTPRSEKEVYMFMAESTVGYKRCQLHDVAINTMWAYMGALGAAPCAGIVSPSYNVYRLRAKDLLPEYFDLICRTPGYITQINRHSKGVWKSRLRLYPDAFYEMLTPIPPIDEQCRIEEAVHYQDEEMQPLAHGLQTSIDCLKEYRTALISAAVTGRIDVREETA